MSRRRSITTRMRRAGREAQQHLASAMGRVVGSIPATRARAITLTEGAGATTTALQALPDSTLRWLTAGSVGLGVGLFLAGAPRLATAAGVTPAVMMGAAMVARTSDKHRGDHPSEHGAAPVGALERAR
jgi:hypothetical protein